MTWTYRLVKEHDTYSVREVFDGKQWTRDEISPSGDTRDEVRECITTYINDITKLPILIVEDGKIVGEEEPLTSLLECE